MMLYVVVWFIVGYTVDLEENFWHFLTYWGEGVMVVYFTFAFGVALHGIFERSRNDENEKSKFCLFPFSFDCSGKKMSLNFILNANESLVAYTLLFYDG